MKTVTAQWAYDNRDSINILDVRETWEFNDRSIPGSTNVSWSTIFREQNEPLDKDKEYYLICQTGSRSEKAALNLEQKGFNVVNILGGVEAYKK